MRAWRPIEADSVGIRRGTAGGCHGRVNGGRRETRQSRSCGKQSEEQTQENGRKRSSHGQ